MRNISTSRSTIATWLMGNHPMGKELRPVDCTLATVVIMAVIIAMGSTTRSIIVEAEAGVHPTAIR
jgi:hypothetical protein